MHPQLVEMLGHLAYALIFISFSVRSMLALRLIAIVASAAVIFYSMHISEKILWVPIYWNLAFIALNLTQIGLLVWHRRNVELNALENFLHENTLRTFGKAELRSFLKIGQHRRYNRNQQLIRKNEKTRELFLLIGGGAKVVIQDDDLAREVARLGRGSFVGEMSFLTNSQARADVFAANDTDVLAFSRESLENWLRHDPARSAALQTALGGQVIDQLMKKSVA